MLSVRIPTGLPTNGNYKRRPTSAIVAVVVHHAGVNINGTEAEVRAIARYHVEHNGWPGIGYHYVIAKDGTVWKTNPISYVSYHAAGFNIPSVGVCLAGNLDRQPPTKQQEDALRALLQDLNKALGRRLIVRAHREVSQTACPGRYGMDLVERVRASTA